MPVTINSAISNSILAIFPQIGTGTILGRISPGTGDVEELSKDEVIELINIGGTASDVWVNSPDFVPSTPDGTAKSIQTKKVGNQVFLRLIDGGGLPVVLTHGIGEYGTPLSIGSVTPEHAPQSDRHIVISAIFNDGATIAVPVRITIEANQSVSFKDVTETISDTDYVYLYLDGWSYFLSDD